MALHDLLGDGQTQPRAPRPGGTGGVQPVKFLENVCQLPFRDLQPLVGDVDLHLLAVPQGRDADLPAGGAVIDRVAQDVVKNPDKLVRVFDNVLRNAVNYSTPGGEVRISALRDGQQVEIHISNEGLEIPEGELANIFQKFYRLDAARSTRTGGAGLGLAIAKEIVERHGGTIRAESNGRFTSFVITLPLYDAPSTQA